VLCAMRVEGRHTTHDKRGHCLITKNRTDLNSLAISLG
jgi:hypothetical protein